MKKKVPKDILLEMWEGSRETNSFFKSISKDAFIGYITGLTMRDNPSSGLSASEWFSLAKGLVEENLL